MAITITTIAQFNAITDGNQDYILGNDLDFGNTEAKITPSLSKGIDGAGFTIKNVVNTNTRMFAISGTNSYLKNLNFENITVNIPGTNAHIINCTDITTIDNLKFKNISITTTNNNASIFSSGLFKDVSRILVDGITVNGNGSYVSFLFASINNSSETPRTINKIEIVNATANITSGTTTFGGIIGFANIVNSLFITNIKIVGNLYFAKVSGLETIAGGVIGGLTHTDTNDIVLFQYCLIVYPNFRVDNLNTGATIYTYGGSFIGKYRNITGTGLISQTQIRDSIAYVKNFYNFYGVNKVVHGKIYDLANSANQFTNNYNYYFNNDNIHYYGDNPLNTFAYRTTELNSITGYTDYNTLLNQTIYNNCNFDFTNIWYFNSGQLPTMFLTATGITNTYIKINGVWQQCSDLYIKENGLWIKGKTINKL